MGFFCYITLQPTRTTEEFENLLIKARMDLVNSFKDVKDVTNADVYVKAIFDHQQIIVRALFGEFENTQLATMRMKDQIINDNRDRF